MIASGILCQSLSGLILILKRTIEPFGTCRWESLVRRSYLALLSKFWKDFKTSCPPVLYGCVRSTLWSTVWKKREIVWQHEHKVLSCSCPWRSLEIVKYLRRLADVISLELGIYYILSRNGQLEMVVEELVGGNVDFWRIGWTTIFQKYTRCRFLSQTLTISIIREHWQK